MGAPFIAALSRGAGIRRTHEPTTHLHPHLHIVRARLSAVPLPPRPANPSALPKASRSPQDAATESPSSPPPELHQDAHKGLHYTASGSQHLSLLDYSGSGNL